MFIRGQDKIACSQFIIGIYNIGVKQTFQLERITSPKFALAWAFEVKVINEQNSNSISEQNMNGSQNTQKFSGKSQISGKDVQNQDQPFNQEFKNGGKSWVLGLS